jgi:catalase
MTAAPVRYTPDVEQVQPDEAETQAELIKTFRGIIDTTNKDFGHAFRSVHAKSHALLEGELAVLPDLPAELAQGIFAEARTYAARVRISTNAGDPLPDSISLPRGFALKVIGVEGERLDGASEDATQDFVLANGPVFSAPDAKGFLKNLKLLAATTDKAEWGKKAISAVLRSTEKVVEAVGGMSPTLNQMGGHPHLHPLGERYFSQVPIRYGDHIAKIAVVPLSANFKALEQQQIEIEGREDALREEIARVLAEEGGQFELRVQLARDLEKNPIEDATVQWPEDDNPYVAVATITVSAQPSWTWERSKVLDDETAFSPWHGIEAHRPLGNLMRARKPAYEDSAGYRSRLNGCPIHEPARDEALPA